jgi:replicative superfamily II helicase
MAYELANDRVHAHLAEVLREGVLALIDASIWSSTRRLGQDIRRFVEQLTAEGSRQPILELWPSQRQALQENLLDPARRAVVVEMPTSAGKTLVAEFAIVQSLALNPESRVAYVVPTRALVNQVSRRLRTDMLALGHRVEAAVPVFELDPTEDTFLRQPFEVLVVTPEKLDLLVRSAHPAVETLSLVVVVEGNILAGDERGARVEMLLATL